jgi:hypothetical protein
MSAHFHREDSQVPAGKYFDVGTAAGTQQDWIAKFEAGTARAAACLTGTQVDLEAGAVGDGAFGGEIEAERHRIGHDGAQCADFQPDAVYASTGGVLTHGIDDTLRQRHLVHVCPNLGRMFFTIGR